MKPLKSKREVFLFEKNILACASFKVNDCVREA